MIHRLMTYWRNSLADEDLMGAGGLEDAIAIPGGRIENDGAIPADIVTELRRQWGDILWQTGREKTSAELEREEDPEVVPVVLSAKALVATHSHGKTYGNRKTTPSFTMTIPAILGRNGRLIPDEENQPWIGREFLEPTDNDSDGIPVVGMLADFDGWLDRNPLQAPDWPSLMAWCGGLWTVVTQDQAPSGFVAIDEMRIQASKTIRDMARHIRKLYDALLDEPECPLLMRRVCEGTAPQTISRADRLARMSAPRGSMTASYGLADSQADAVVAVTKLGDGNVLAVNGPPGTGKTTLLQSIIATEVVSSALAGGNPAIIMGCSTNNHPVMNINEAMNEALAKNRTGERRAWARRWIADAQSYGLFLPSTDKAANEAQQKGIFIATRDGNTWNGFPARETDGEYVAQAARTWREGFAELYGGSSESLEDGAERIRADLGALLARVAEAQNLTAKWAQLKDWWWEVCDHQDISPERWIETTRKANLAREDEVAAEIQNIITARETAQVKWADTLRALNASADAAKVELAAATQRFDDIAVVCGQIHAAAVAQGVLELVAEVLPLFRGYAAARQHARMSAVLGPDERALFRAVVHNYNRSAWFQITQKLGVESQTALDLAKSTAIQADGAVRTAELDRDEELSAFDFKISGSESRLAKLRADGLEQIRQLQRQLEELRQALTEVRALYDSLHQEAEQLTPEISRPKVIEDQPDWLAEIDKMLDVTVRHEMFQKAMRYWEGRWIIEAQKLCADNRLATKNGREAVLGRFRRWCMLTPCIISTLHSLPKYMRFSNFMERDPVTQAKRFASDFLLGEIDLLIMDESGQVGPHVGMASFSLAKRAVVVGDIYQLEPVVKITAGTDYANSVRAGLGDQWIDGYPAIPHLVSESASGIRGSVMRVIQSATTFMSPNSENEPGIFLSEHRRCDPTIIAYCNDLVYSGRLKPVSKVGPKAPDMRAWGWAHVRGVCKKGTGGSRVNEIEANAIADWIVSRAFGDQGWLAHYQKISAKDYPDLRSVVAVVTPFKAQARLIKQSLAAHGGQLANLIVGTVDALQGAECPIVIFSPTYSLETGGSNSLFMINNKPNRLNVAVSRAKDSFVVIGDMRQFRRDQRRVPSSLLAKYLFSDPENEIVDVGGNHSFPQHVLVKGERISTLDGHRAVLANAIRDVQSGETLIIVSPYISLRAVVADGLPELCRQAVVKGALVHAVIDRDELAVDTDKRCQEAVNVLKGAGVSIHSISAIHNKTIVVGRREIVEGSFNWLSAVRDPALRGIRYETSWRISGEQAAPIISKAVAEIAELGVRL